jgi:Arc/MetJ family transcription regulator
LYKTALATNLNIDPKLLEEALAVGGLKTKKETVNQALREFIITTTRLTGKPWQF